MMIPSPILFGGCLYSAGAVLVEFILKEYRPSRILQKLVSFLRYSVFTTVRALLFNQVDSMPFTIIATNKMKIFVRDMRVNE